MIPGTKCSHYGALLHTGALGKGRIRCPWHGACFSIETGDIEEFPGMDAIPCYNVKVEKGLVKVRARKSELEANKRVKSMMKRDPADDRTFVVVGGGPSAAICAETLRQHFAGRIVMICKEKTVPYDRIKVSKTLDFDLKKSQLRTQQFYEDNHIETMLNVEATNLSPTIKEVTLSNGYKIKYDKIYIATGSKARMAPIPGADLKNIFTLRDYEDSMQVFKLLAPEKHVVVLGVSFIGLEAAASCVTKVAKVSVIGRDNVPLKPVFGEEIGARIMKMCQENNVAFVMNSGIMRCIGNEEGELESVELNDGTILKADVLIMGVGTSFYTDFLKESGVEINRNGSIDTNQHLETNVPDVFVGGDIANAPIFSSNNEKAAIGHYGLAQYHGKIAALNMAGKETELKAVPYFWSLLFGKSIRYAGYGKPKTIHIDGDLEGLKFLAFYFDENGIVISMASCGRDPVVSQFAEYLSQGMLLYKTDIQKDPLGWISMLNGK